MLQNLSAVPLGAHRQRAKDIDSGRRLRLAPGMARAVVCGLHHGRAGANPTAPNEDVAHCRRDMPDVGGDTVSVDMRQVKCWLKDGAHWHVVTSTGPMGAFTACNMLCYGGKTEQYAEPPTRICRRCRLALKDAFLAGEPVR